MNTFCQNKVLAIICLPLLLFLLHTEKLLGQEQTFTRVFKEYLKVITTENVRFSDDLSSQRFVADHFELYTKNAISERDRILLYRSLFLASDMKSWSPELQTILLYRLVKSDTEQGVTPAYLLMEKGYNAFVERANEILSREFQFLKERISFEKKKLEEQGVFSEVELSEEIKTAAVKEVYEKLKAEAGAAFVNFNFPFASHE